MAEYIDRELLARSVAVKKVQERLTGRKTAEQLNGYNPTSFLVGFEDGMQTALDIIFAQPSADMVEVVRCKQCCYFMKYTADDIAEGIDAEGADGRCFIRVVNSKDNQFCAVKNDDFCSKVKPQKGE